MPVKVRKSKILRGVIRAQTKEAIGVCNRLLTAFSKNTSLPLFGPFGSPNSTANMNAIITQWQVALTEVD